jgi:hypothetical protein
MKRLPGGNPTGIRLSLALGAAGYLIWLSNVMYEGTSAAQT